MFYPHELCVVFRLFIPRAEQLDLAILGPPGCLCPAAGRSCGLQRPIRTASGQLVGAGDHGKLSQGGGRAKGVQQIWFCHVLPIDKLKTAWDIVLDILGMDRDPSQALGVRCTRV